MQLAKKHGIPGRVEFAVIKNERELAKLDEFSKRFGRDFVIKADGLMGGKGVFVGGDHFKSLKKARDIIGRLLKRGPVVLQEKLVGTEFSGQYFAYNGGFVTCPYTQDHKRAFENDKGANTGGMGSYSDGNHSLPFLAKKELLEAKNIVKRTLEAMHKETGCHYIGVLYPAFMKTKNGIKWIEFNCRLGDPEGANAFMLLRGDFAKAALAAAKGGRMPRMRFAREATVVRYATPPGYPQKPVAGKKITVRESKIAPHARVLYADAELAEEDGRTTTIKTGTSRTFAIAASAKNLERAKAKVDKAFALHVKGKHHRRDDIPNLKKIRAGAAKL